MIRQMQRGDVDRVYQIQEVSFSGLWSRQSLEEAVDNEDYICLIREEEERIVGYCILLISYETAELCQIAVDRENRQRGSGARLLDAGVKAVCERGAQHMLLEVRAGNGPAIALYDKFGFQKIHIRKNYYQDPVEDALILEKDLTVEMR